MIYKASVFLSVWLLGVSAAASDDPYFNGEWRSSLTGCWTDPTCNRVMTVSHGGDWNYQYPYDSQPAFERAYMNSADAVKGDFRVTSDNIGVVMHSSPVKFYESFNCYGKKVEEMTAEECTQCKMAYTNYTFTTVPDMLAWAKDMVNVMYCVKESGDIPRAITTIIENGAQDRAFLEISVSEMLDIATASDGWDEVYYVIELKHHDDVSSLLVASKAVLQRTFMVEFQNWEEWDGNLDEDIELMKSSGIRTFAPTRSSPITATVQNHLDIFDEGFQVVYTYNLTNAVDARQQTNTKGDISPP